MKAQDQTVFPIAHYADLVSDALALLSRRGVDEADLVLSKEQGFSASARNRSVETLEYHQEQGLAVTVYCGKRSGSASTTMLTSTAIRDTIDKALSIARFTDPDPYSGLADKARLAFQYPDCDLYHPWSLTPEAAIDMALEVEATALACDSRIVPAEASSVSTYESLSLYANTLGFMGQVSRTLHSIACGVVVKADTDMQRDFEYTSSRLPEDLDTPHWVGRHAAEKTLKRLNPRKIKTQQCPILFHAPVAKSLLGAFVGAISGGALYRKSSFLVDAMDTLVFPESIDIYQQPHLLQAMASAPFDAEGVSTENRHFVAQGILRSFSLGSYSARKLGLESTGNAGGVYNLTISPSDKNFQALLKMMGTGLLVTELMGQGVRIMTGDYSRGAFGFWVEDGEIQYPVSEITVAGNLKAIFSRLVCVGNDVDLRGRIRTGSWLVDGMTVAGA